MTLEALGVGELVEQEYIEREESLTQNPEEAPSWCLFRTSQSPLGDWEGITGREKREPRGVWC